MSLLCAQTLELGDIEQQIQAAVDFFGDKVISDLVTDRLLR
jgi:hypothetical protein